MEIDPRLRGSGDSSHHPSYNQQRQPSRTYSQAPPSAPFESQPATPASTGQTPQQHYYPLSFHQPGPSDASPRNSAYPQDEDGQQETSDPLGDLKRPRACEACRALKVKCELDDAAGTCKRCAKANRQCVITTPSRKRQKKTDSRVAELEKKIDALTQSLQAQNGHTANADVDPTLIQAQMAELQQHRDQVYANVPLTPRASVASDRSIHPPARSPPRPTTGTKRRLSETRAEYIFDSNNSELSAEPQHSKGTMSGVKVPTFSSAFQSWAPGAKEVNDSDYVDVIDRGLVDMESARKMFQRFVTDMAPQLPAVVFPPDTTADEVRKKTPLLFLAILAAASGTIAPRLQIDFTSEVVRTFADRVICRGKKSLELVQGLLVTSTWYQPPDRYEELNFNQLIHIAAVMGIDLGMGKRTKASTADGYWKDHRDKNAGAVDPNGVLFRRTWLGCYFMCANAAMSLRRPILIRWQSYMEECISILETSPDAAPTDMWLCHLVRAQHIAEEVGFQFSMDDPTSGISIGDPKTQYHLKSFERQLEELRERANTQPKLDNPNVRFTDAIISLFTHEIAMHHDHNIDDFKPPYLNKGPAEPSPEPDFITPTHIGSLSVCLHSIHKAFNAFLEFGPERIRNIPTLVFVRNSYAAVALIKMHSAVTGGATGKFGSIFKKEDLKVEEYLASLVQLMRTANTPEGTCRVAGKFAFILDMLGKWHGRRKEGIEKREAAKASQKGQKLQEPRHSPEKQPQPQPPRQPQQPQQVQQPIPHTQAPQMSTSAPQWSSQNLGTTSQMMPMQQPQRMHSGGLQMLSEAASSAPSSMPMSNSPPNMQPYSYPPPSNPYLSTLAPPGTTPGNGVIDPNLMSMGGFGTDLDSMGFNPDDIGSLMDDAEWLRFSGGPAGMMDFSGMMGIGGAEVGDGLVGPPGAQQFG